MDVRLAVFVILSGCAYGPILGTDSGAPSVPGTTATGPGTTGSIWTTTPTGVPPFRPFPQGLDHGIGKPGIPQDVLDADVARFFDDWKASYLRESNGNTPGGGYYIEGEGTGYGSGKTTSEAHGYGMIVFALMAGHDPDAQWIFDGLYNMYDQHRSTGDPDLMSWVISESESTSESSASATDGDLDIAYGLLLAHHQWGSSGAVDYRAQAMRILGEGVVRSEIAQSTMRTLLGDWDDDPHSSRPSDWMTGHFAAFAVASGDPWWNALRAETHADVAALQSGYAPSTGLLPDFVVGDPLRPAGPWFLESEHDGAYYWNACRVPWRLTADVAHYGSADAAVAVEKMADWIVAETGGDPWQIKAGYTLSGQPIGAWNTAAFAAPLVAASAVDPSHQAFLDSGWVMMTQHRESYYEDSINLLTMLLLSGNWWAPGS